jgi:hypothetical protein
MDTNFNYTIVINQKLAVDFNNSEKTIIRLNFKHLAIYSWVKEFIASGACEERNGYFWFSYDKIISDNPLLDVQKRQVACLLNDMCKNSIFEFKMDGMSRTLFKRDERFKELSFDYSNSDRVEINLQGDAGKTTGGCRKNNTNYSTNINNTNINENTTHEKIQTISAKSDNIELSIDDLLIRKLESLKRPEIGEKYILVKTHYSQNSKEAIKVTQKGFFELYKVHSGIIQATQNKAQSFNMNEEQLVNEFFIADAMPNLIFDSLDILFKHLKIFVQKYYKKNTFQNNVTLTLNSDTINNVKKFYEFYNKNSSKGETEITFDSFALIFQEAFKSLNQIDCLKLITECAVKQFELNAENPNFNYGIGNFIIGKNGKNYTRFNKK